MSGVRMFKSKVRAARSRVAGAVEASPAADEAEVGPPRVAVLTMVRDEALMLPKWLAHYGAQVGVENLYVVDDNSVDGSTDGLACNVLRVPAVRGGKFESTRMRLLGGLADSLLALYDAVLFADADEFIVADPQRYAGLVDFVAAHRGAKAVGVLGLNVLHHVATEPALDLSRPVLEQRTAAKFIPVMCKPSLNLSGARWIAASHGIKADYAVSPDLYMFHLKYADRDLLYGAAEHRKQMVELDGRSRVTSWRRGGDELVGLLEAISTEVPTLEGIEEFSAPGKRGLKQLVIVDDNGNHRAPKGGQVQAMESRAVLRIPERFRGLL